MVDALQLNRIHEMYMYCICQAEKPGKMIQCDNEHCEYKGFILPVFVLRKPLMGLGIAMNVKYKCIIVHLLIHVN